MTTPTLPRHRRTLAAISLATIGLLVSATACGSETDTATTATTTAETTTSTTVAAATGVTASGAWARQSPMVMGAGAAYLTLTGGDVNDELVGASVAASIAATVELHETVMADDPMDDDSMSSMSSMTMRQVTGIAVPAGTTVELKPGGLHIMLIDLTAPLVSGETFDLSLTFASGETLEVPVEVRAN
jgi:copper(I)-binding protein